MRRLPKYAGVETIDRAYFMRPRAVIVMAPATKSADERVMRFDGVTVRPPDPPNPGASDGK